MEHMTDEQIREAARYMLAELASQKLEVVAIPDGRPNSSRKVRVVVCPNPEWYSEICRANEVQRLNRKWRRPRTNIKRWRVIHTLKRIADGHANESFKYHAILLDAIARHGERFIASDTHTHRKDSECSFSQDTSTNESW